jgi:hypothetical protein
MGVVQNTLQEATESEPPQLPNAALFAWSYFMRLHQTRQSGGFGGFSAISYQEMLAFFTLEQTFPEPYELELIRLWDNMWLKHYNKQSKDKPSK